MHTQSHDKDNRKDSGDSVDPISPSSPKMAQASEIVSASLKSSRVSVSLQVGPISTDFDGTVCALGYFDLYGVYGDMSKAPSLAETETPKDSEPHIECVCTDPSRSLTHIFIEDWKRLDGQRVGISSAIDRALTLASERGATEIVIPLPNCSSQYFFADFMKALDGMDPALLSSEEVGELKEYCVGTKAFLDRNPDSSISSITFIWSEDYSEQLSSPSKQVDALPSSIVSLEDETFTRGLRHFGQVLRRLLK